MASATSSSTPTSVEGHLRLLTIYTLVARACTLLLVYLASYLPAFDSSASTLMPDTTLHLTASLLRWDAFHFAHIAQEGYVYEYEWAFFPGLPFVMNILGHINSFLRSSGENSTCVDVLLGGALAAVACSSARTLYRLSLHHLGSPSLAFLASLLSLLPSSPATLHYAAYTEPFFAFLSYKGMLACARKQWFNATLCFALAGTFRSNGFFLGGFLIWGLVVVPFLDGELYISNIAYATLATAITFLPFIFFQSAAYILFCTDHQIGGIIPVSVSTPPPTPPSWCNNTIPSIYTHVQRKYWNIGFLNYWTLSQLPNFLLAAPVLALLFIFTITHICAVIQPLSQALLLRLPIFGQRGRDQLTVSKQYKNNEALKTQSQSQPETDADTKAHTHTHTLSPSPLADHMFSKSPFFSPRLTPHAIHALVLSLTLLFNSHTQIVLRLAASMPITYWAAAWLMVEKPWWGRMWVGWSVVWGAVSVVLWTVFLPPA